MKNRRALSGIVGYVLMIVIAISLSILVYGWLKDMLPKPGVECPEGVSISLEKYGCDILDKQINLTIKNNGLFDVYGVFIRISNESKGALKYNLRQDKRFPEIYFNEKLIPNNTTFIENLNYKDYNNINEISIQPLIVEGEIILCENSIISQTVEGCS
ncbi:MAG: hypothetical protein KJ559_03420 [Nanoarchaeota archaeon]|nr:hypothetical protein [Nanoarchaeota archaeon]